MHAYIIGQVHSWMPKQTYIFETNIIDIIAYISIILAILCVNLKITLSKTNKFVR